MDVVLVLLFVAALAAAAVGVVPDFFLSLIYVTSNAILIFVYFIFDHVPTVGGTIWEYTIRYGYGHGTEPNWMGRHGTR